MPWGSGSAGGETRIGESGVDGGELFTPGEETMLRRAEVARDPGEFRRVYLLRYPGEGEARIWEEYEWWVEKVG